MDDSPLEKAEKCVSRCVHKHFRKYRLQWAIGLGVVFGVLGFVLKSEVLHRASEFSFLPAAEALLSKTVE